MIRKKFNSPLFVWEWNGKCIPWDSPFGITRLAGWCQTVILGRDCSDLHHTHNVFFYSCTQEKYILIFKLIIEFLSHTCYMYLTQDAITLVVSEVPRMVVKWRHISFKVTSINSALSQCLNERSGNLIYQSCILGANGKKICPSESPLVIMRQPFMFLSSPQIHLFTFPLGSVVAQW